MYKSFFKHIIDFSVALFVTVIFSPLLLFLVIFLTVSNRGKPFFVQRRPGKNAAIFKLIKFKTMNDKVDINGVLLSDDKRLTKVGKFVRKTSLDELPQMINVLKGDMSLIGPRPLLVEYLEYYNDRQAKRHNVKPGITGWAQINGRNSISWSQKFEYDIWYIENRGFILDMRIVLNTIKKVFISEGISSTTSVTMEKFNGRN